MYDGRWGEVQHRDHLGFGIYQLSTAGHGGIVLSAAQNKYIPEELRRPDAHYEEDLDAALVYETFMLYSKPEQRGQVLKSLRGYYASSIRDWLNVFRSILDFLEELYGEIEDLDAKLWSDEPQTRFMLRGTVASVRRLIALERTRRLRGDVFNPDGELDLVVVPHEEAFTLLVACSRWRYLKQMNERGGFPCPGFLDTKRHPEHGYAVFSAGGMSF